MKEVIKIKDIDFRYSLNELILSDVSFNVTNEIVCVLAPTGAGKTTLLNVVSGLIQPTKGEVKINGNSPIEAVKKKKIGFSFQDSTLIEWRSVVDNVLLPLQIGIKENINEDIKTKALDLIALVGLSDFKDYKCSELSGGMKQRVGLARALMTNPDVILFDEPFNKLDFITKTNLLIEFRKILKERKVSCLLVTHNIEDAVLIGDKVLVFSKSPCSLKKEISIPIKERNIDTLKSSKFLEVVTKIKEAIYNAE